MAIIQMLPYWNQTIEKYETKIQIYSIVTGSMYLHQDDPLQTITIVLIVTQSTAASTISCLLVAATLWFKVCQQDAATVEQGFIG